MLPVGPPLSLSLSFSHNSNDTRAGVGEPRGEGGGRRVGRTAAAAAAMVTVAMEASGAPDGGGEDIRIQVLTEPLLGRNGHRYSPEEPQQHWQQRQEQPSKGSLTPRLLHGGGMGSGENLLQLRRSAPNSISQLAIVGSNVCPIESLDYEYYYYYYYYYYQSPLSLPLLEWLMDGFAGS